MEVIESELRQTFASIVWTHKIHEKQADIYSKRFNLLEFLKILSSVMTTSGILTCLFLDEFWLKISTTIFSAICLFINTYYKTYNLNELSKMHKSTALELFELRDEAITVLSDIKNENLISDKANILKNDILKKYHLICKNALITSNKAVEKASLALKNSKDNSFSDSEIDSYLPIKLRKEEKC